MKYNFSKNDNGSWVVHNDTDKLPVGSITKDGKLFCVAGYNNMKIDHELMCAISEFMSYLRITHFRIKNKPLDLTASHIDVEVGEK